MDASTHSRAWSRLSGEPSRPGPSGGEAGGGRTAPWFPEVSRGLQQREGPPGALTAGTGASTTLGGRGTSQVSGCWGGDGPDAVRRRRHRRALSRQRRTREDRSSAQLGWGVWEPRARPGSSTPPPASQGPAGSTTLSAPGSGSQPSGLPGSGAVLQAQGPPGGVTQPPPRPTATPLSELRARRGSPDTRRPHGRHRCPLGEQRPGLPGAGAAAP